MIDALTPEEQRELLTKVREIHAAMLARRAANRTEAPAAPSSRDTRSASRGAGTHDPNDPVVKILPKNWKGEDLRGKRYSECPPLFLGQLSHMLDAFADKNEEDPERQRYAKWDRENAIAARRWRAENEGKRDLFDKPPMSDADMEATF